MKFFTITDTDADTDKFFQYRPIPIPITDYIYELFLAFLMVLSGMYYASLEFKVDKFWWKVISEYILETELKKLPHLT